MKRRKRKIPVQAGPQVGIAWFTREQWQRLTEVVDDRNELDGTFEQWERNALAALYKLNSQGHSVRKVMVNVETLAAWCRGRGRRMDGAARAGYVIALLGIADGSA
ncbi:MAG: hypothetical protein ACREXP_05115 [Steroidobacteraceae bacterium]